MTQRLRAHYPHRFPETTSDELCACHGVSRARVIAEIRKGADSVEAVGQRCAAGTGCGSCRDEIQALLRLYGTGQPVSEPAQNKVEAFKAAKDGLDVLPVILRHAEEGTIDGADSADLERMKWYGLFLRKPTPGYFMLRVRGTCGRMNSAQFRVIADICDEFGKGFCDITTRQQIQLRWFTIRDVPEIWRRLSEVGLHSMQTGHDNVRGIVGCPVGGLTPEEAFDAYPVARELTERIVGNKAYTNLPRKFNITITGCKENCCHTETQDIALVPARALVAARETVGFNVLVGGKQGSGGYTPALPLNVFVPPDDAATLCETIISIFRDHGNRKVRNRARLRFLIEERGLWWLREEVERRLGRALPAAGEDLRHRRHNDHVGIYRQKQAGLNYVGLCVPVGRLTSAQLRGLADLADRYGDGDIRLTPDQNVVIPNVPDDRLDDLTREPLLAELTYNPSPVMRGLVSCTGNDYCALALIDTKGWAIRVARRLEELLGDELQQLKQVTIRWSGCAAGCGLHQVADIGLQACRKRLPGGQIVPAAHVFVRGQAGPHARVGLPLLAEVPCEQLAETLVPLLRHLSR